MTSTAGAPDPADEPAVTPDLQLPPTATHASQAGIDAAVAQSQRLTAAIEEARARRVEETSSDGSVVAVAAGGRLLTVDLTPVADRLPQEQVAASLRDAVVAALKGSNTAVAEAATGATEGLL
jgi:hypothetical protein